MASEGGKGGDGAVSATSKIVDWEAIEGEYRAGQLSVVQIGKLHGVSHTAIQKRAKKFGWQRNLTKKVRDAVAAKLVADAVAAPGVIETAEAAIGRGYQLALAHRHDIGTNRSAVTKLIDELHEAIDHAGEIEEDIEAETAGDKDGKRRARMMAAVALPSRAGVANTLAQALKTLIPLERQAFNLDDRGEAPDGSEGNPINVAISEASAERLKRLVE